MADSHEGLFYGLCFGLKSRLVRINGILEAQVVVTGNWCEVELTSDIGKEILRKAAIARLEDPIAQFQLGGASGPYAFTRGTIPLVSLTMVWEDSDF